MKIQKNITATAMALALAIPYLSLPVAVIAQRRVDPQAQRIEDRDRRESGITVTDPRVFDDAQLQQRLQELEARLATLQAIDQKGIAPERFGAVAGASLRSSGFALNVQGAPVPGVDTTTKLPTEQVTTDNTGIKTVTNTGIEDVTTKAPQFNPPTATAPAPTVTMPSTFSVSASDILDEMMQVQAEINGLRLLLSGDLSSHFVRSGGNRMTKFRTTLGFNISVKPDGVEPDERYKDAVAIVEVEVENVCQTLSDEPPMITTLLPREKTYNVAEITESSTSIGAGVATQIVGFSGSWVRGHKTHYLVRDQDTIALTFTPEAQPQNVCSNPETGVRPKKRVGFMWQFRPVLGRRHVRIAEKTTFVQLAFAVPRDAGEDGAADEIGHVTVRTYWRGYDRKRRVHKEIIPGSVREQVVNFDIPRFKLLGSVGAFNFRDSIEDLGGGNILVKLDGNFLPGTSVRIGPTILSEGDRFKHRYSGIRFSASLSDLATKRIFLVAHDGTEVPLVFRHMPCNRNRRLSIVGSPRVTAIDETNSRVTVRVSHPELAKVKPEHWREGTPPIVFVIGQRVFGFPDAPLQRIGDDLSFVVPSALVVGNPDLIVQTLFPDEFCVGSEQVASLQAPSQTERLVTLEQGDKTVKFLLYGTRLSGLQVLAPADTPELPVRVSNIGNPNNADRVRLIEVDVRHLKTHKNLLAQRLDDERPFLIPIPSLEAPKKPDPPKASERVTVSADEAVIVGEGLKDVAKVHFRKRQFDPTDIEVADDGKSLRLSRLTRLGVTSTAATQPLVLEFKSGAKATVNLEVVNSKVESVAK